MRKYAKKTTKNIREMNSNARLHLKFTPLLRKEEFAK